MHMGDERLFLVGLHLSDACYRVRCDCLMQAQATARTSTRSSSARIQDVPSWRPAGADARQLKSALQKPIRCRERHHRVGASSSTIETRSLLPPGLAHGRAMAAVPRTAAVRTAANRRAERLLGASQRRYGRQR